MEKPCDRNEIGLQLQAAAEGIGKAKCPEFNDLQVALKELSGLILPAFKQPNSSRKFDGSVNTNYYQIINKIDKLLGTKISENNDDEYKKMFQERQKKYVIVRKLLNDATTEAEVEHIITDNKVKFNSNSILSGGTRRRKTSQRKRAKTLKNKKKVGKRK